MSRRRSRKDGNHADIVAALESCNWFVYDTAGVGDGFFDAIAVDPDGRVVFIEIKDGSLSPSRRELTPEEIEVHRDFTWAGAEARVLLSVEEALAL